jgi:potassium-transporting ATPase KdpC subunit
MSLRNYLSNSIRALIFFTLSLGVLYPLLVYGVAQIFFHHKADGNLVYKNGMVCGSNLIGQKFENNRYFSSRPSAIDYNPMPSGASNFSLTSDTLLEQFKRREAEFIKFNGLKKNHGVPADMLFASGSGVDPDISKTAACLQVNRIARARNFDSSKEKLIYKLIDINAARQKFNFTGVEYVNVLELNLQLDELGK